MKSKQFGKVSLPNAKKWAKAAIAIESTVQGIFFQMTFSLFYVVLEAKDR